MTNDAITRKPKKGSSITRNKNWKPDFIKALIRFGNVAYACRKVNIAMSTAYDHREKDEQFGQAWTEALEHATATLEREAWRRAVKGNEKPIYQQGIQVGSVREYSDTLLIFLLKGYAPHKYKDRAEIQQTITNKHIVYEATITETGQVNTQTAELPSKATSIHSGQGEVHAN